MATNRSQHPPTQPGPAPAALATTQYLKISYSSKRRMLLDALAKDLDCSWQSIALAVIDEFLDREYPLKKLP